MVSRGNDAENLLSIKHVATRFSVSIGTVRRWTDAGLLPAERTAGGHRRYRATDVEAALRARSALADAEARQGLAARLATRDEPTGRLLPAEALSVMRAASGVACSNPSCE
ncbi:hypothetical protein CTKZ_08650 [Cellulomonas algicola]|uniref:HTH merR-type domain-containing protein n=1 Tax=Cellulomonas algicola TaxID=2071633 RepID=A0A401UX96_9CELL|nr:helix-turn-helix domain-containing protein [Cellulomonas algicola]GCD19303.1 hypothetical protein CTKZ_08650 [Cellulomonas algicola]